MARETGSRDNSNSISSPFDKIRSMVSRIFGGKGNQSESSSMLHPSAPPGDSEPVAKPKGPVIVELNTDDEGEEEEGGVNDSRMNREKAEANANPLVEHPEDQTDDQNKRISKDVACLTKDNKIDGTHAQTQSFSYRRVTHGGINGAYYTAATTRRTGSDGMVIEDCKQADKTTGQATHRISRGIHDKGHSLTRKLDSDGKVNTMQTLHNLEEDELAGFEKTWKGNADKHLPGWNSGSDFHRNAGSNNHWMTDWNSGFGDPFGRLRPNSNAQAETARGRPKKVIRINTE